MKKILIGLFSILLLLVSGCSSDSTSVCKSKENNGVTNKVEITHDDEKITTVKYISTENTEKSNTKISDLKILAKDFKKAYKSVEGFDFEYEVDGKKFIQTTTFDLTKLEKTTAIKVNLAYYTNDNKIKYYTYKKFKELYKNGDYSCED